MEMDIMSYILIEIKEAGFLNGFCIDEEDRRVEVTHLLYAEDAIVFSEGNADDVTNVLAALVCFQSITGVEINLQKTRVHPVGKGHNLDIIVDNLGCDWEAPSNDLPGFTSWGLERLFDVLEFSH
ncbi:unnamed protein product [Linum trigynum]|uniref:Reverse transcriptase domain-containing protein n=1 Tax=Linum trigynum TaxID=586398 RepID=A0AAV2DTH6_9ROSI